VDGADNELTEITSNSSETVTNSAAHDVYENNNSTDTESHAMSLLRKGRKSRNSDSQEAPAVATNKRRRVKDGGHR
jgi:hypothetical protein